ncbi:cytochrome c oxidase assembly protein [Salinarimonas soli]|uniref:Cytochrome c oxidase assembly protein CtaG n=1 Tax=Salinarimonas soli TaxID=1638099 RepID=A0A5B2V783_9HYPH|nr:cytochrome c oxidase assembly protein [Salinarimonas soli]KAA2234107.1 cytochrome c oxidase assembly protein [Salinarimonas soli]
MTATPEQARSIRRTAIACTALVAGMVGAAYASVPLYDLFCRVTGFEGTPMIAKAPSARTLDRTITVRFDANVNGLPWRFSAESPTVEAKLGETMTVMYKVENIGSQATTGIASFNVQPALSGAYFNKIQCFCFTEQTLQPGEAMESAVVFFVDPAIAEDPNTRDLTSITLSYTYFPVKGAKPVATSAVATGAVTR